MENGVVTEAGRHVGPDGGQGDHRKEERHPGLPKERHQEQQREVWPAPPVP